MSDRNSRKTKVGVVVSNKMQSKNLLDILFTVRLLRERRSSELTTKKIHAASVIQLKSWRRDLSARARDGDLSKS